MISAKFYAFACGEEGLEIFLDGVLIMGSRDMAQVRFDDSVQPRGAATSCHEIHREIQKSFDIVFEANKTNQAGNFVKIDQDIHIMGFGFAAGDGAEDVKVPHAHSSEFGKV